MCRIISIMKQVNFGDKFDNLNIFGYDKLVLNLPEEKGILKESNRLHSISQIES